MQDAIGPAADPSHLPVSREVRSYHPMTGPVIERSPPISSSDWTSHWMISEGFFFLKKESSSPKKDFFGFFLTGRGAFAAARSGNTIFSNQRDITNNPLGSFCHIVKMSSGKWSVFTGLGSFGLALIFFEPRRRPEPPAFVRRPLRSSSDNF